MKPLHRRPLLKKIAIGGLSIGTVGSLVSCSASGGGSGESDNATVDLEPVAAADESDNVSNPSGVDLDESLEVSDNATVEENLESSIDDVEENSESSIDDTENASESSEADSNESSEVSENAIVEEDPDTPIVATENENNTFNADLIIDTTDSNYSVLANPDGSLAFNAVNGIPNPGILVHRTSQDSVNVVSRYCTHLGCTVGSNYVCACHNSRFSKDGSVLQGPASIPLKTYTATVNGDSILINFS